MKSTGSGATLSGLNPWVLFGSRTTGRLIKFVSKPQSPHLQMGINTYLAGPLEILANKNVPLLSFSLLSPNPWSPRP